MPGEPSEKTFTGSLIITRLAQVLLLIGALFFIYEGPEIVADAYSDHPGATLDEAQNVLERLRKHPFVGEQYTYKDGTVDWMKYNKEHPETISSPGDTFRAGARWFAGYIMVWAAGQFYIAYLEKSNRLAMTGESARSYYPTFPSSSECRWVHGNCMR